MIHSIEKYNQGYIKKPKDFTFTVTGDESIFEMWLEKHNLTTDEVVRICTINNTILTKADCELCGEVNYIPVDKKCFYCGEELLV